MIFCISSCRLRIPPSVQFIILKANSQLLMNILEYYSQICKKNYLDIKSLIYRSSSFISSHSLEISLMIWISSVLPCAIWLMKRTEFSADNIPFSIWRFNSQYNRIQFRSLETTTCMGLKLPIQLTPWDRHASIFQFWSMAFFAGQILAYLFQWLALVIDIFVSLLRPFSPPQSLAGAKKYS